MKLAIKFSNLLAEKYGKEQILQIEPTDNSLSINLNHFLEIIKQEVWSVDLLDVSTHTIKEGIVMIVDNELIQLSQLDTVQMEKLTFTEQSDISFHVMFAGG